MQCYECLKKQGILTNQPCPSCGENTLKIIGSAGAGVQKCQCGYKNIMAPMEDDDDDIPMGLGIGYGGGTITIGDHAVIDGIQYGPGTYTSNPDGSLRREG